MVQEIVGQFDFMHTMAGLLVGVLVGLTGVAAAR